jgi:hypothetical protein
MRQWPVRLGLVAALLPLTAAAQSWRTFDVARQLREPGSLGVHVAFGAGRVSVQPTDGRNLFDVHLRYDAERAEPIYRYDVGQRQLEVGVRHFSNVRGGRGYKGSELQVALARGVPMRLELDVGAAEGDINLTGLELEAFTLKGGATETRVRFDAPNPGRLTQLRVDAGAASLALSGLGHANVARVDANVGVGKLELDFGGPWRGDVELSVTSALGSVELKVPSDVAIRVEKTSFLHSFNAPGLTRENGYWVSDNWATAKYKLRIRATGTLGSLEIARVGR